MTKINVVLISIILGTFLFISCGQETDTEKPSTVISSDLSKGNNNDQGEDEGNKKKPPINDTENDDTGDNDGKDSILCWIKIAEATLAEVSKPNANYKISSGSNYETIVDGNKMDGINGPYVTEGKDRFRFSPHSGVWYKTPHPGGWTDPSRSITMGEWAAFSSIGSLRPVLNSITNYQNVTDLGEGKYSYFQNGFGPDPDTYIFTTADGLLTKSEATEYGGSGIIMYRTFIHSYIYGGQTVTLPSEYILTVKLSPPKNIIFNDGILTWDEVEGAGYYSGDIYKDGRSQLHFLRIDSAELDFHEYALRDNWTSGIYKFTVRAIHPTTHTYYRSDTTSLEFVYDKLNLNQKPTED